MPVRVRLDTARFGAAAARLLRDGRVSRAQHSAFARRCGLVAHHDDRFGLPRICVAPYGGAPLLYDCLGMTSPGDVARLYRAHLQRLAEWVSSRLVGRSFAASDAFVRRNRACGGFFVLA
jgi:hypothetical protein